MPRASSTTASEGPTACVMAAIEEGFDAEALVHEVFALA